jgi:hypothetical protein
LLAVSPRSPAEEVVKRAVLHHDQHYVLNS